jgi:hypothetical protein
MKVAKVEMSISRTVNLGNFGSERIEVSATVEAESGAGTPKAMRARLLDEVDALMVEGRQEFMSRTKARG